jgi:drug/metabolite transporter (DMT)-like permease
MKRLPVNVAVPLFHSYPAVTYLLQVAALGVLFRAPAFAGVLLVVAGVTGFSARRRGGGGERLDPAGIGLVLTGSVVMAVATVSWKALQAHFGKLLIAFGGGLLSTLAVLLLYAPRLRRLHWGDRRAVLGTAASGVLVFGLANVLSLTAMQTLDPALVFAIVATSVLWTAVIGFLRLGERWTLFQFLSACLVVGGIFLMSRFAEPGDPQPPSPQEVAKEDGVSIPP